METKVLSLDGYIEKGILTNEDNEKIALAADIIKKGGLVAFPTETVYGLGGNALDPEAAKKIYKAKGRPSDNPLIVHISKLSEINSLINDFNPKAKILAAKFWPGPMTIILAKSPLIPTETTGGLMTVAIRYPSHPVANKLIELSHLPIAAPSANLSGRPSTTSARHCIDDLMGRVDAIIDGGEADVGLESTIIDLSESVPALLRPGAITREMIEETLGEEISIDRAITSPVDDSFKPKAPGMKYRHYAPKAPMILVKGEKEKSEEKLAVKIAELYIEAKEKYEKVILVVSNECGAMLSKRKDIPKSNILVLGSKDNEGDISHNVFDILRKCDDLGAEYIIAEGFNETDIGMALMNRMKKAAAWNEVII